MTHHFQACIGPTANRAHLRDPAKPDELLTLCEKTAHVRDYKAQLEFSYLCQSCAKKAAQANDGLLNADIIGVEEII